MNFNIQIKLYHANSLTTELCICLAVMSKDLMLYQLFHVGRRVLLQRLMFPTMVKMYSHGMGEVDSVDQDTAA